MGTPIDALKSVDARMIAQAIESGSFMTAARTLDRLAARAALSFKAHQNSLLVMDASDRPLLQIGRGEMHVTIVWPGRERPDNSVALPDRPLTREWTKDYTKPDPLPQTMAIATMLLKIAGSPPEANAVASVSKAFEALQAKETVTPNRSSTPS